MYIDIRWQYNSFVTWKEDRSFAKAVAELAYCNPFLSERVDLERAALGDEFESHGQVWHPRMESGTPPNLIRIQALLEDRLPEWRTEPI